MDNAEEEQLRQWVAEQTECLSSRAGWRPDTAAALQRFHDREWTERRRAMWTSWPAWAAAAALLVAVILMLPAGRAAAQQLWQLLTVRRVGFIQVKPWPEGVPSPQAGIIGTPLPPLPANNVDDVRRRVRFEPRLPRPGVLSDRPRFYTTFSLSAGIVLKAADLELALQKAGVRDQSVPQQWDGVQIALHTSAIAIAQWPDLALAQSLPLTLTAPPGFDFPAFSALVLRILGVRPDEAQRLAQQLGTAPPWLAPITPGLANVLSIEEINLNSGPATLLQERGRNAEPGQIALVWSVPDRVYVLSGTVSRELAIATANAVE